MLYVFYLKGSLPSCLRLVGSRWRANQSGNSAHYLGSVHQIVLVGAAPGTGKVRHDRENPKENWNGSSCAEFPDRRGAKHEMDWSGETGAPATTGKAGRRQPWLAQSGRSR
jgi:hypothetical protein